MKVSKPKPKPASKLASTQRASKAEPSRIQLSAADMQALTSRLRRAEGQVRAVARLIEEGEGCEAVAQQLTAARRALDRAFFALVGCAVTHGEVAPDGVADLLSKYA